MMERATHEFLGKTYETLETDQIGKPLNDDEVRLLGWKPTVRGWVWVGKPPELTGSDPPES